MAKTLTTLPELDESTTKCRLCLCYSPSWANKLADRNVFMACYGFASIVQGMLFMYYVGVMTTIEAHFQLPSEAVGIVMSVGEIVPIFTAIIFSYFFGSGDRPRWMCACLMLVGIGCHVVALPYYIYGATSHTSTDVVALPGNTTANVASSSLTQVGLCNLKKNDSDVASNSASLCIVPDSQEHNVAAVATIVIGYTLFNIGATLLYIVGTPYLDDNVQEKNSPIYLAIICSIRTVGPMVGFLLSSACLLIYINPMEDNGLSPEDKNWLGAWWLGFVIIGSLSLVSAFIIVQFPRVLPSQKVTPALELEMATFVEKQPMNGNNPADSSPTSSIPPVKEMWSCLKRLMQNWMLIARTFSGVFTWFGLEGYIIYLPKYFEQQFSMTASEASSWTGFAFMIPMIVGNLVVGVLLQKFRPSARQLSIALIATKLIYAATVIILVVLRCDNSAVHGSENGARYPVCDINCDCSPTDFNPVCSTEGLTYFSPCHAGCTKSLHQNTTSEFIVYEQCACIPNGGRAFPSQCQESCSSNLVYVILTAIGTFLLSVEIVGGVIFGLRCVDIKDKTLAMGIMSALLSILTFFPCPLVFAALVDNSCSVWGSKCGEQGACWVYDMDQLRWILHALPAALIVVGAFWDWIFMLKSNNLRLFGSEDSKEDLDTVANNRAQIYKR